MSHNSGEHWPGEQWHRVDVEVDGRMVPCWAVGKLDGVTIIFIHGFSAGPQMCREPLLELAAASGARIVSIPIAGYRGTKGPSILKREFDFRHYAEFTIKTKRALQHDGIIDTSAYDDKVILMGWSEGGAIAAQTTHDYMSEVMGLIGIDPIGGHPYLASFHEVFRDFLFFTDMARQVRTMGRAAIPDYVAHLRNLGALFHSAVTAVVDSVEEEWDVLADRTAKHHVFPKLIQNAFSGLVGRTHQEKLASGARVTPYELDKGHSMHFANPKLFGLKAAMIVAHCLDDYVSHKEAQAVRAGDNVTSIDEFRAARIGQVPEVREIQLDVLTPS